MHTTDEVMVANRAADIAEYIATGRHDKADRLHRQVLLRFNPPDFDACLLSTFARRARVARVADDQGAVCRLREAALKHVPAGEGKECMLRVFRSTGAIGYQCPQRSRSAGTSMLAVTHG